jgi:hypothetical protein
MFGPVWSRNLDKNAFISASTLYSVVRNARGVEPVKRTVACASFITALLLSATGLMLVNLAAANPMWYLPPIVIKSDGTVAPETEFVRQDGNVYTLTADLPQKYSIKIQCSNIVFDGAGHTIDGAVTIYYGPANNGLSLESVTNVTVKDVQICDFGFSDILIENCHRCSLFRVVASAVVSGSENTITESSLSYLDVKGSENLVLGNTISILISNGEANIFMKNNITDTLYGGGSKNIIIANRISSLYLEGGLNNTFCANAIDWFRIEAASNLFYDNNFINVNPPELAIYGGERGPFFWDNGEEGNYWRSARTRYTGVDANDDGIGDLPYTVNARYFDDDLKKTVIVDCGIDNYPLMSPFDIDDVSIWLPEWAVLDFKPDQSILIQSPKNTTYTTTDIQLNFTAPKSTKWTRYSLDGQANVTITGNTTLTELANGCHNLTLYIDGSLGNTRPSETITFTIARPELFPTTLVAAVSGASVAVIGLGLLLYFRRRNHRAERLSRNLD